MSSKLSRFFEMMISGIVGSFFFLIGVISVSLPWSTFLQQRTIDLISDNSMIPFLFGFGFILIGLSIVIYTFLNSRHRTVEIKGGKQSISLDENVIRQSLENYWLTRFPNMHIPCDLIFKKHSLKIVVNLSDLPIHDEKDFLEKVKDDFEELFGRALGYPHEVHLVAQFNH